MNNQIVFLVILAVVFYCFTQKGREGFKYAEEGANAVYAQPSYPAPAGLRNTPPVPDMVTLSQMSGNKGLMQRTTMKPSQVDAMLKQVGKGRPDLQDTKDIMPTPDMRYAAGLDPTDPDNFIYERTLFAPLKRRYGNNVDFFRGDIDVTPEKRGWFDTRSVGSNDVVKGYFSNYTDIQQQTTLRDSYFDRNVSAQEKLVANTNPFGDVDRLNTATI
jgi:hypothetical protein